jgi:hypothetical protein
MTITASHFGHLHFFPALSSWSLKAAPHFWQLNDIIVHPFQRRVGKGVSNVA